MIRRSSFFAIAVAFSLGEALLLPASVLASVPDPQTVEWERIEKTLSDSRLPSGWHDAANNSIVYYHLRFGTEHDAVKALQRARSEQIQIRDRESLAHFAVMKGKEFALRELIASGVSPNANLSGETLLMAAAREEQLGIMRLLIASGADVNYRYRSRIDSNVWSDAAMQALGAGKYNAARLLFSAGYKLPKGLDAQSIALFFQAISGGSGRAVAYMLDNYDIIATVDSEGETPLTFALQSDTTDAVVAELLLRGANPCKRNKAGESVPEVLAKVNKDKKSYDARFASLSDRLVCQQPR